MNIRIRVVEGIDGPMVMGAFCPLCDQEAMPMRDGTCGWCDTPIIDGTGEPLTIEEIRERTERPQFDHQSLIDTLQDVARDLGRTPFKREWERFGFQPCARTFIRRFGSWSAAVDAAGLEAA